MVDEKAILAKSIAGTIQIFGANGEDPDQKEYDERQQKVEEYLETLDPKKREWETRKIEHYKKTGKEYLLPGEQPSKPILDPVTAESMMIP